MTIAEIAEKLGASLEGDGCAEITGVNSLDAAGAGEISFLSNPRYAALVAQTAAAAVIVNSDWEGAASCAVIRVANADAAFGQVASWLAPAPVAPVPGVHPSAVLADDVVLGADVCIGPHCVLESGVSVGDRTVLSAGCVLATRSVVGADCRLYPNVTVREDSLIGDRVIIHNGAVIGSDGFGYVPVEGRWEKIPQVGHVEIGNDVEIGANTTIDRARFGTTVIEDGVKLDNLVQIAHNVRVGAHTAMAAQVGIAGSTKIGAHVQLGGQAGVSGHLTIGDHVVVGGQAGVLKDLQPAKFYSGYPAMPHEKATKMHAHQMRIPAMKKKISELEKRIAELEEKAGGTAG